MNETRPENDPERLAEEVSWADVLFAEQRYLEALETYRRVLEQYLKTLPPDDPRSRDVRFKIAKTFLALGDTRSAREMLERVAESDKTNPPIDPDARAEVEVALGHAAEAEGDLIGAHRSYFLALQHFGAARRVGTPAADPTQHALEKVSTALAEEADAAEASGDPEGADAKRAEIASTFRTLQLDSPIRIRVLESRTRAAQHRCDLETAITLRREIVQVLASREDPDRTTLAEARRELAALLRVVSDTEGAREVERQIRD